jgi:Mycothiol maleylpyruvate isomerase N-terminal domain
MEHSERDAFLAAARVAVDLVRRPQVSDRWADGSACQGMTVGGLACHLASQLDNTVGVLGAGVSGQPPIGLVDHYARAAWVRGTLDEEANVGIREGSNAQAAAGPDALLSSVSRRLEELPGALASVGSADAVLVPWQGWSLTAHDFLVTRMMEIVVHSDDLAVSIEVDAPEFSSEVLAPVLGLLTDVAVLRHGATAVVRALTRPQRAPESISAF